jgi:glyoxylase-like metal-dependent hydrolase (beta-lactamase superfamily II)
MAGMTAKERASAPRTERVLPGIWRLRLPLPWPGVPHGNAWALQAGDGIVLFDTGMGGSGRMRQLDLALAQAGFGIEDIGLVVCTHSHTDHYGLAHPPAAAHAGVEEDDAIAGLQRPGVPRPAASSGCTRPGNTCG